MGQPHRARRPALCPGAAAAGEGTRHPDTPNAPAPVCHAAVSMLSLVRMWAPHLAGHSCLQPCLPGLAGDGEGRGVHTKDAWL